MGTASSIQAQAETQIATVTSLPNPQEGGIVETLANLSEGTYALKFVV